MNSTNGHIQNKSEISLKRFSDVLKQTGMKRSTLWLWINRGTFPKPIKLGEKAIAWPSNEIDAWIAERISLSRKTEG